MCPALTPSRYQGCWSSTDRTFVALVLVSCPALAMSDGRHPTMQCALSFSAEQHPFYRHPTASSGLGCMMCPCAVHAMHTAPQDILWSILVALSCTFTGQLLPSIYQAWVLPGSACAARMAISWAPSGPYQTTLYRCGGELGRATPRAPAASLEVVLMSETDAFRRCLVQRT